MKKLNKKPGKQKRAFTLVELLIVVGIIGILIITLVVAVNFSTDKAKQAGVQNIFSSYETAAQKAALQGSGFNDDLMQLASMLNKSLDSELKISVVNNALVTNATDTWGQTIKIGYSKPDGTVGQVKFVSSGPDMVLGNKDDIISVVTYRATTGSGNAEVSHPQNSAMHNHLYGQQVQSPQYLAKAGSCKTPAVYYLSCECGDVGYDTFTGTLDSSNHINTQTTYEYIDGEKHMTTTTCAECLTVVDAHEDPHQGDNYCLLCYGVIHTHAFNQTNIEEKYLYRFATCTSKAIYYYSCGCGEVGTETFEFGNVLAHDYTAQVASSGYLAENASCVQAARYFYSCTMCGEKGAEKFVYGEYNRENHVGVITFEYSPVDATQHMKSSICNACSHEKESQVELHNMNEQHTCTLCGTHTHVFDQQVANDSHLRDSATCTSKPTYFYSCNCGASGTEYFESGDKAPHTYTAEKAEPEYLKSNATCINKSVYYKSCIYCGEKGAQTFEYGDVDSTNHVGQTTVRYNSVNDVQHVKETLCSSCGVVIFSETENHTFDANNNCTICNNHVHVFDKQVVDNKYLKSEATCVAKAVYYYSCNCGEVGILTFEYGNKTDHIFTAEVPSEEYIQSVATCIDKAVYYRSCTGCGLKGTTVFTVDGYDANNHVGVEVYAGTKEVHSKYSCCGATISTVHSYTRTTEIPATCIAMGTSRYTCDCTYTYTDVDIPINPNNHVGQVVYGGTKDVHTKYNCCNATVSSTHTYDQNKVDSKYFKSAANCVDKAVYYKSCKCGYSDKSSTFTTGSVDPNNHKGPIVDGGTKTCHKKCSACGVTTQGESYHSYTKTTEIAATCVTKGTSRYTCTCGYTYTSQDIAINPSNHAGPIVNGGTKTCHKKCSACGVTTEGESYHNYTKTTEIAATCVEKGTSRYTCNCGYTYTSKDIAINPGNHAGPTVYGGTKDCHTKCNACGTTLSSTHTYNQTKVASQYLKSVANCVDKAVYYKSCICGYSDKSATFTTGDVNPNNHKGPDTYGGTKACHIKCGACGVTLQGESYHDMKIVPGGTSATCTKEGSVVYKCDCGYGYTTTINKLGHAPATTATWNSDHSVATVSCTRSGCTASWSGNSTVNAISGATCTSANTYNHKATFSVNGTTKTFTCPTTHSGSALGHLISNPPKNITWSNDNKRVTITCERSGCGQTWTYDLVAGDAEITDVVNPTCTTTGSYKCIIKVTINGKEYSFKCPGHTTAALGHLVSSTPKNVTWTSDHSKVTVQCERSGCTKTWSGTSTEVTSTNATCTVARKYYHSATFSVNGTTKTLTCPTTHTGSKHSHTWSYPCDTVCNCCGCTRTASHDMQQTKAPTCTATGTKTCSYGCGTTETIAKLGHDYSGTSSTYTWATGHTSCTATRPCGRSGCDYVLTETKSATKTTNSNATCTQKGKYDYRISSWSNSSYFTAQSCPDWHYTDALGHNYSGTSSSYSWSSNHTSCTATRPCGRSGCSYVLTETKSATKTTNSNPTCTTQGKYDYRISSWSNSSYFTAQSCPDWHYTDALGHSYSGTTSSYSWNSGHTSCTASRPCGRSGCSYVLTETKSATQTWNTNTTCTTQGKYDYRISSWSNSSYFTAQNCPDWHYQNAYNHSNVTFIYNQTADGGWAAFWDTKHCKIKVCVICNAELSREDESHDDKSYNQLGTGDGTIWDSRSGICTICKRPWFRDGTG